MTSQGDAAAVAAAAGAAAGGARDESGGRLCELLEDEGESVVERSVFEDAERLGLLVYTGSKWANGTTLTFGFLEPQDPTRVEQVRKAVQIWEGVDIGIQFREVAVGSAMVRISTVNGGSWSYLGRAILRRPAGSATMNIGWNDSSLDTAVHELGHTLGFPHEHQSPKAGIKWNEKAVYASFSGPPNNWDRRKIYHNVLRKLPPSQVDGSDWDSDSIMHYQFKAGLIDEPAKYKTQPLIPKPGLSSADKATARRFYPPLRAADSGKNELTLWEATRLEAGKSAKFVFTPEDTTSYQVLTLGASDTFVAIFDNEDQLVAFDDDSGVGENASITTLLNAQVPYTILVLQSWSARSGSALIVHPRE